jgi:uncharacterized protein YidB (DUF937 family)
MTVLLGLLAIAGYQNRDKIAEMLKGVSGKTSGAQGEQGGHQVPQQGGSGDILGRLATSLGGASVGSILSGGLGELMDRFKQSGHGDTADSWVRTGPNKPISPPQLEQAIGPEVLDALSKQTGLSREELVARLSRTLPEAVDKYTPQGHIPTEAELARA